MKARLPIGMQIAVLAVAGIVPCFAAGAQGSLQSQLEAKYTLTKPTDDKSDIVTAGAVLVLQKDRMMMYSRRRRYRRKTPTAPAGFPRAPTECIKRCRLSAA